MQIYANFFKNAGNATYILQWILIVFVRAWRELPNFYTEFSVSYFMQIYANFSEIYKKNGNSYYSWFWIWLVLSDRAWLGVSNFYTEFWNSVLIIMQICVIFFQKFTKMLLLHFTVDFYMCWDYKTTQNSEINSEIKGEIWTKIIKFS